MHKSLRTGTEDRLLRDLRAIYRQWNINLTLGSMTTLHTAVEGLMDRVQTSIVRWKNKLPNRKNIYIDVLPRTTQSGLPRYAEKVSQN